MWAAWSAAFQATTIRSTSVAARSRPRVRRTALNSRATPAEPIIRMVHLDQGRQDKSGAVDDPGAAPEVRPSCPKIWIILGRKARAVTGRRSSIPAEPHHLA